MKTFYEWVVNEMDDEYILENYFFDTYADATRFVSTLNGSYEIELKRDKVDECVGVVDRGYAQLKDGKLDEYFDNGPKVPQRFHQEVK